jgi:hypothetical protein
VCAGLFGKPCPVCAWDIHEARLRARFGDEFVDRPGAPAFPNEKGEFVTKDSVFAVLVEMARRLSLDTHSEDGHLLFTAHGIRIA